MIVGVVPQSEDRLEVFVIATDRLMAMIAGGGRNQIYIVWRRSSKQALRREMVEGELPLVATVGAALTARFAGYFLLHPWHSFRATDPPAHPLAGSARVAPGLKNELGNKDSNLD